MLGSLDRLEDGEIVMHDSLYDYNNHIPLKAAGTFGSNRKKQSETPC